MISTSSASHCWWTQITPWRADLGLSTAPEEQQQLYRRTFVNLPMANGNDCWELPIPATYVLDSNGTIMFAAASEDYTERPEPLEILAMVDSG
jgi:peroxiredoxin